MILEFIQWALIIGLIGFMSAIYYILNDYTETINSELFRLNQIQNEHNISKIVKVVKSNPTAKLPYKGSKDAAGYDLCAALEQSNISIPAHETVKINTGLKMEIPKGYAGLIYARSGLATKEGLAPANKVGILFN